MHRGTARLQLTRLLLARPGDHISTRHRRPLAGEIAASGTRGWRTARSAYERRRRSPGAALAALAPSSSRGYVFGPSRVSRGVASVRGLLVRSLHRLHLATKDHGLALWYLAKFFKREEFFSSAPTGGPPCWGSVHPRPLPEDPTMQPSTRTRRRRRPDRGEHL